MTLTTLRFSRWVGGPTGHAESVGRATWDDGALIHADAAVMRHFNAAKVRTLEDVQHIFRGGQFASAYGWPFIVGARPAA